MLAICSALVIACVVGNVWYASAQRASEDRISNDTKAMIAAIDVELQQIKDRKAAEEKARQDAAQKAAEQARTATSSTTPSVESASCNASKTHNNPASIDVVVNKKHCLQPVSFAPADLQTSNGATLSSKAITAYNQLFAAAVAAGQPFSVTSSYRSYNDQVATYAYWVRQSGKSGADTYSARPGYSEHQTGLVFDAAAGSCVLNCFGSTSQYQWLQQNAATYGFIQRYYAGYEAITGYISEEWHYRYVGVDVAKDMQARGIKTLEQYWNIPGGDY